MTLPLHEDQLVHFAREGYVVIPDLVPVADCSAVRQAVENRYAHQPAESNSMAQKEWTALSFFPQQVDEDRDIHQLLIHRRIMDAAEQILNGPARIAWGMSAVVPAGGGRGLPWHHDNMYIWMHDLAINIFIALADIVPEQCGLWIAPRSHYGDIQRGVASVAYNGHMEASREPENGIPMPRLKAGDACIFSRTTLHRSFTNLTNHPRFAYAAQFTSRGARNVADGRIQHEWPLVRDLADRWSALP